MHGDPLRGWAFRIRTGESVRELSDWNWKPDVKRDPGRDTYASPDLFTNYADFYARAAAAAKTAYRASRAQQDGDFKTYVGELRVACDSCHGLYLKSDQ